MRNIEELRKEIDKIDQELVALFERRMDVVNEVAKFKIATGKALKDSNREKTLIEKNITFLKNKDYKHYLKVFFKDIMESSRSFQSQLIEENQIINPKQLKSSVVFQGVEGSFSSLALKNYFGDVERYSVKTFEDVFMDVYAGKVNYGIVPIENSSTGAINEVYDLLKKYDIQIVGEYYQKVSHHLIALEDAELDDIKTIYSHAQGFKQCSEYLKDKDYEHLVYLNTAKSVEHIKNLNKRSNAAIASSYAAEIFNLKILEYGIENNSLNTTRFVIIAKHAMPDKHANKISLVLSIAHEPQALFKVLEIISRYGINMLKIESRPIEDKPWSYAFYIDIEGHLQDAVMTDLMDEIRVITQNMMILGNYHSTKGV